MTHYIAVIHKDAHSSYGVSFPDVTAVHDAGETLEEAIAQAAEALAFAAEDWRSLTGTDFPAPRTIDDLRDDPVFAASAQNAIFAAIPFDDTRLPTAAE